MKCLGYIIMKVMTVFFVIIVLRLVSSSNLDFFLKHIYHFHFILKFLSMFDGHDNINRHILISGCGFMDGWS